MDDSEDSIVLALPASTAAPGIARREVSGWLRAHPLPIAVMDDVVLVVSELVTNAVEHASSEPELAVAFLDGVVRVSVHDNQRTGPQRRSGGPDGGFGLQIVARTSRSWGWAPTAGGKIVWAELSA
jgi:anti-sigma regulatory factor (Ser/Thr protein kinase)